MARKSAGTVQSVSLEALRKFAQSGCMTGRDLIARPSLGVVGVDYDSAVSADGTALHIVQFSSMEARALVFSDADKPAYQWNEFSKLYDRFDHRAVTLSVHRAELLRMVKLARVWDETITIVWHDESGWLTVSGKSYDGDSSGSLPARYPGRGRRGDFVLQCDGKRLTDSLRALVGDTIELSFVRKFGFHGDPRALWLLDVVQTEVGAVNLLALVTGKTSGVDSGESAYNVELEMLVDRTDRPLYPANPDRFVAACDMPKLCKFKAVKAYPSQLQPGPAVGLAHWRDSVQPAAIDYKARVKLVGMLYGRALASSSLPSAGSVSAREARYARYHRWAYRYMRAAGILASDNCGAFQAGIDKGRAWSVEARATADRADILARLYRVEAVISRLAFREGESSALRLSGVSGAGYEQDRLESRINRLIARREALEARVHYTFNTEAREAKLNGRAYGRDYETIQEARAWVERSIERRDQLLAAPHAARLRLVGMVVGRLQTWIDHFEYNGDPAPDLVARRNRMEARARYYGSMDSDYTSKLYWDGHRAGHNACLDMLSDGQSIKRAPVVVAPVVVGPASAAPVIYRPAPDVRAARLLAIYRRGRPAFSHNAWGRLVARDDGHSAWSVVVGVVRWGAALRLITSVLRARAVSAGQSALNAPESCAPVVMVIPARHDKPADVCQPAESIKPEPFDKPAYVRPGRNVARSLVGKRCAVRPYWRAVPSPAIIPAADPEPEPVPSPAINAPTFDESINALTFDDLCGLLADRLASAAIGRVNARLVEVGRELRTAQAHIIQSIEAAQPAPMEAPSLPSIEDLPLVCDWDKGDDVRSEPINPEPFGPDWSEWGEFWDNPPAPDLEDTQPMPVVEPDDDPDPSPDGGGALPGKTDAPRTITHIRGGFDGTHYEVMDGTGAVHSVTREAFNQTCGHIILPHDRFSAFCEFLPPIVLPADAQTESALQNANHSDEVGGLDDKPADVCEPQEAIKADTFDAAWRGRAWVRLYWRLGRRAMDAYAAGDVGLFERLMTRRERLEHEPLRKRWNGGDIDRAANLAAIREFFPGVESNGDNYSDDAIRDFDWHAMKHGVKVGILEIDRAYLRFSKLEHELGIARRSNASAEAIARIEHDIYAARRWAGFWMVWRSNEWRAVMEYYQLLGIADDLMDRVLAWDSAIKHANSKDEARTAYTELVMAVRNGLRWDEQIQAYRKHLEGVYRLWGSIPVWSTFYTTFGSRISAFAQRSLGTTRKEAAAQWHIRLAKNEVEGMNKTSHRRREAILRSLG